MKHSKRFIYSAGTSATKRTSAGTRRSTLKWRSERWLHRWKDPAGHARVIAEMDIKGQNLPVEWRRPHGQVRRVEARVNDGKAQGSHAGVKRPAGEIDNYRSVGSNNLSASAVLNSSSFYSSFSKSNVPVFNAQLLDRNAICLFVLFC
jgi:hypothetical protein